MLKIKKIISCELEIEEKTFKKEQYWNINNHLKTCTWSKYNGNPTAASRNPVKRGGSAACKRR